MNSRALKIHSAIGVGFSFVAVLALSPPAQIRQQEAGPRVIPGALFATSETVEGARLSPNGSEIALVTSQVMPSADHSEGDKNSLVEIWSIEKAKRIARVQLSSFHYSLRRGVLHPETRVRERFIRYASNGKRLVVYDGEDLRVLELSSAPSSSNTQQPDSVRLRDTLRVRLDLGLPQNNTLVQSMEVTLDGSRAVLAICNPRQSSAQTIRVYDLVSGSILQEWKFGTGCFFSGYSPISWDHQGARLAVSLPAYPGGSPNPFSFAMKKNHVNIVDVNSGKILREIPTGYIAGPVYFTHRDTILIASLNADSRYFREDAIREWSVSTGRLVRKIEGPPQGVHSLLALSADGNLILGYTGLEKPVEHFLQNVYLEFSLWDYRTGKLVATSGYIERPKPSNSLENQIGPPASFGSGNDRIVVSQAGNKALVWWQQSSRPFLIYDLISAQ